MSSASIKKNKLAAAYVSTPKSSLGNQTLRPFLIDRFVCVGEKKFQKISRKSIFTSLLVLSKYVRRLQFWSEKFVAPPPPTPSTNALMRCVERFPHHQMWDVNLPCLFRWPNSAWVHCCCAYFIAKYARLLSFTRHPCYFRLKTMRTYELLYLE